MEIDINLWLQDAVIEYLRESLYNLIALKYATKVDSIIIEVEANKDEIILNWRVRAKETSYYESKHLGYERYSIKEALSLFLQLQSMTEPIERI